MMIFIYFLCFIIFYFIILVKRKDDNNYNNKKKYIVIRNIYIEQKVPANKCNLIWVDKSDTFMKNNWPNQISFDFHIKNDILKKALSLKTNNCIIDSGSHIGDLVIPLAHALTFYGREDIVLYAIEPDKSKCDFIFDLCKKNKLKNVKILNYALSNNNELLYQKQLRWYFKIFVYNSGAIEYDKISNLNRKSVYEEENLIVVAAKKLDTLVKNNKIKEKIGIIHLDVEGFEKNVLIGGSKTIERDLPYLSIENNKGNKDDLKVLPKAYTFLKRLHSNNIFRVI